MRVLVTSTPGAGHLFPMVPTVLALRRAGHQITWASGPEAARWLDGIGVEHVSAGLDAGPRGEAALELVPGLAELPPVRRRVVIGPTTFGRVAAPPMADALGPLFDAWSPELVLTEPCELAGPALAAARGIPHVTVGFGGLLPGAVVTAMAEAVEPIWAAEGLVVPEDAGLYQCHYFHPFPPSLGAVPDDLPITLVRPGEFDGGSGPPEPWVAELGGARQLVYATFGTEFTAQAPFGPLLEALGKLDAQAVLTVGTRQDPASFADVAPNVRIEQFVAQRALLERASLVVSHGGSGTVLGAAAHGAAQVCLPLGADQFDNAAAVAAAGAGVRFLPDEVSVDALVDACERLLADPPVAARTVADEVAAMPTPDEVVPLLEALGSR